MPSVLIADDVAEECKSILLQNKIDAVQIAKIKPEDLVKEVAKYDGLIVRSRVTVTKDVIEAGKNLKIVGRAGIGVDNIDVEAATRRGIVVMNTPQANVTAAAEHTFSLLLSLARNIPRADASIRGGNWERSKFIGVELEGKTVGIVGLGRVGAAVARYSKAFGAKVISYDPFISKDRAAELGVALVEFPELLERADFITVHVPLTEKTRKLFSKNEFKKMKKTARLINTSRGGVVDEDALYQALANREIAGAALDVFEKEPPPKESRLFTLDNVILTPHLGASTEEAQMKVAVDIAEQFAEFFTSGVARNAVNVAQVPEPWLQPFVSLTSTLGMLASQLCEGRIKTIEITYAGDIANSDTRVLTSSAVCGVLKPISESVNIVNATFYARERQIAVVERKTREPQVYRNLVTVRMETDEQARAASGTIFEGKEPRIVSVDGYRVDVTPSQNILVLFYPDVPGVVGKFGTILGSHNINIADMAVGRSERGKKAVIFVTVDSDVPPVVLNEIRSSIQGIEFIKAVKL